MAALRVPRSTISSRPLPCPVWWRIAAAVYVVPRSTPKEYVMVVQTRAAALRYARCAISSDPRMGRRCRSPGRSPFAWSSVGEIRVDHIGGVGQLGLVEVWVRGEAVWPRVDHRVVGVVDPLAIRGRRLWVVERVDVAATISTEALPDRLLDALIRRRSRRPHRRTACVVGMVRRQPVGVRTDLIHLLLLL